MTPSSRGLEACSKVSSSPLWVRLAAGHVIDASVISKVSSDCTPEARRHRGGLWFHNI